MKLSRIMKNIQAFVKWKTNKAVGGEIPTKILRECQFTFDVLTNCINKSIKTGYFPDSLKLGNIAPVFKKESFW